MSNNIEGKIDSIEQPTSTRKLLIPYKLIFLLSEGGAFTRRKGKTRHFPRWGTDSIDIWGTDSIDIADYLVRSCLFLMQGEAIGRFR